jgi:hypothetical protein
VFLICNTIGHSGGEGCSFFCSSSTIREHEVADFWVSPSSLLEDREAVSCVSPLTDLEEGGRFLCAILGSSVG